MLAYLIRKLQRDRAAKKQYLTSWVCASIGHLAQSAPTSLDGFLITFQARKVLPGHRNFSAWQLATKKTIRHCQLEFFFYFSIAETFLITPQRDTDLKPKKKAQMPTFPPTARIFNYLLTEDPIRRLTCPFATWHITPKVATKSVPYLPVACNFKFRMPSNAFKKLADKKVLF